MSALPRTARPSTGSEVAPRAKIALTTLLWVAYPVAFSLLFPRLGDAVGALSFVAFAFVGWVWGLRWGAFLALLGTFVNLGLYLAFSASGFSLGAHLASSIVGVVVGALTGFASDLNRTLQRQHALIRHQADHDALTGLLNRASLTRKFDRLLPAAREAGEHLGILFLDLDRFKVVNDTQGHAVGDALLRTVARRLARETRARDLVARLGGDEFVIVLRDLKSVGDAASVAGHLLETVAVPAAIGERSVAVEASIGVSTFPADGDTVDELLTRADTAMYEVKRGGRNGIHRFRGDGADAARHLQLVRDLRTALEGGGLELAYQPIVRLSDRRTTGLEASPRWRHADLGLVPPRQTAAVAAEIGLGHELDLWLLGAACRQARAAAVAGRDLHVNVTAASLDGAGYAERTLDELARTGFPPARLVLEVSEEILLAADDRSVRHLVTLREAGVQIALDDFGAGRAALASLERVPLDVLKFDRAFVQDAERDPRRRALVEAVARAARALGSDVVAAGSGASIWLALLEGLGVTHGQGGRFGAARPLEEFVPGAEAPEALPANAAGAASV